MQRNINLPTEDEIREFGRAFTANTFRARVSKDQGVRLNRTMMLYIWEELENYLFELHWPDISRKNRAELNKLIAAIDNLRMMVRKLREGEEPSQSLAYGVYIGATERALNLSRDERIAFETPARTPDALEKTLEELHQILQKRNLTKRGRPSRSRTNLIFRMAISYEEAGGTVTANYNPAKNKVETSFTRFASQLLSAGGRRMERLAGGGLADEIRSYLRWIKTSDEPRYRVERDRRVVNEARLLLQSDSWRTRKLGK